MNKTGLWVALAGGAAALWLLSRPSSSPSSGASAFVTDRDVDAVTRMLITETSFQLSPEEMAQIVWVAVNRSKKSGLSLYDTVYPPGRPTWNTGSAYLYRYLDAHNNPRWFEAREFVAGTLAGMGEPNRGFRRFVHPQGMPVPPCASNRTQAGTFAGERCLPEWITKNTRIGKTLFA